LNSPNVGGSQQQQKGGNRQRAQSILPCTIGQINKAEQNDDKFLVDGIELNQVVLVGLVRSSNETTTRLDYLIDDMTGAPMEVRQFVDNDENTPDSERTSLIRENIYVCVHGHVRAFGGKRSIVAFRVSPIKDINELTTHMLEVIYAHACLTRGAVQAMDTSNRSITGPVTNGNMARPIVAPASGSRPVAATDGAGSTDIGQLDIGLNPQQQQVLNIIRSSMDEHGMSISVISSRLKAVSTKAIRDAIEFLSSEGHIYSTIDDEHYKATDSC
jgi:replication factor A2